MYTTALPPAALAAAQAAVSSPLLEDVSINGAEGVLVNITGGHDLTLHEVNEAANVVVSAAGEDANVIFGAVIDPNLDGELMITVVATGFGHASSRPRAERGHGLAAEGRAPGGSWGEEAGVGTRERWGRGGRNGDSLEVPTFLRKQMD
jgi:cell division protein FtsZ